MFNKVQNYSTEITAFDYMHCDRSEGPAQVFLLVLTWLIAAFGRKRREDWKRITVSYDNMCHLNNLKVARCPLPLPGDLAHIWLEVNKIIDDLHIKNHKTPAVSSTEHLKK